MKNIHVLPTPNPSRIISSNKEFTLLKNYTTDKRCQNIYITSDEEIKEGDWHLAWLRDSWEVLNYMPSIGYRKECLGKEVCKIILTTDQDLIKDGVHAIDDEFLEWFVKNPSCEEVEINSVIILKESRDETDYPEFDYYNYEIIIPKEEPNYNMKQETIAEMERLEEEPKQETLEEAAEMYARTHTDTSVFRTTHIRDFIEGAKWQQEQYSTEEKHIGHTINEFDKTYIKGFNDGSKWQQERRFSEEDMKSAFKVGFSIGYGSDVHAIDEKNRTCDEWFEQFKKK